MSSVAERIRREKEQFDSTAPNEGSMTGLTRNPMASLFPEMHLVRFNRRQDRLLFFSIVNELVRPDSTVLDFGAGRNRYAEYGRHLEMISTHKNRCRRVIGVDVDDAVLTNDSLDEAHCIRPGAPLPLPDASIDLIFSYAVFEHIDPVSGAISELTRVLKPGGWLCAWTPNKWGYVGLGARLVPNSLHAKLLRVIQPNSRGSEDVFPVVYAYNTRGAIDRYFPESRWENYSFVYNAQPSYNFGSPLVARLWMLYMALTPDFLGQSLMIFLRKK
jgi:SAM-dependent methyltransferase